MKLLHIITSLRTGGAEHLLVDLLPQLREYGHQSDVLLFDGTRTPFFEQIEEQGIKVYYLGIGYGKMYDPLNYFKLKRFLATHTYDVIHTHNTQCQLIMSWVKVPSSTILVTTEHNTDNRRRRWGWYRPIDIKMYKKYSSIICVSKKVADNLKASLNNEMLNSRINVVMNGVSLQRFKDVANEKNKPLKHIVIMVAGFRKQKDQASLIRAMQLLPDDYHLLLVGDGDTLKSCKELASSLNLNSRITFTGVRTDVPSLLASADVAVTSSHYEGFSLSSVEAMAAGKPVIASDVEGLHEVVDGAGLLFPHQDSKRLAELIERVCTDYELRYDVIRKCTQRAELYDISRMAAAYNNIYAEAYNKKKLER